MVKLVMIAAGGAAGALSRYTVAYWGQKLSPGMFPLGTLLVNLIGCFIIGFLYVALTQHVLLREEYRVGILVGFLGAFTTFSTFGYETFTLFNDGQKGLALANVLVSNGAGLLLVWLGYRVAEKLYGG